MATNTPVVPPLFGTPRIATDDDIPALETLINRAYVAEAPFVYGLRTDRADLRAKLATPNTWFLVVDTESTDDGARLAGCVCLDCDGVRGHISLLSVDPDLQGHGLGTRLVRAAELQCEARRGCPVVELEVVSLRTDLFSFYEKLGYIECGTVPFPIPSKLKQPAHMVVMRRGR